MKNWNRFAAVAVLALAVTGCGGGEVEASDAGSSASAVAPSEQASAPAPTGNVIEVTMHTDERGNYFEPAALTVSPGDVVRFVLVTGVHNVSFPSDQNAAAGGVLPGPSEYLQIPGQTFDLPVNLPAGEYAFQCDPHAALGMVGTLTVQ